MRHAALILAALLAGCAQQPATTPTTEPHAAPSPPEPTDASMSLVAAGRVDSARQYSVSSATPGLIWDHLAVHVAGHAQTWTNATTCPPPPPAFWTACHDGRTLDAATEIAPGHQILLTGEDGQQLEVRTKNGQALVVLRLR